MGGGSAFHVHDYVPQCRQGNRLKIRKGSDRMFQIYWLKNRCLWMLQHLEKYED